MPSAYLSLVLYWNFIFGDTYMAGVTHINFVIFAACSLTCSAVCVIKILPCTAWVWTNSLLFSPQEQLLEGGFYNKLHASALTQSSAGQRALHFTCVLTPRTRFSDVFFFKRLHGHSLTAQYLDTFSKFMSDQSNCSAPCLRLQLYCAPSFRVRLFTPSGLF